MVSIDRHKFKIRAERKPTGHATRQMIWDWDTSQHRNTTSRTSIFQPQQLYEDPIAARNRSSYTLGTYQVSPQPIPSVRGARTAFKKICVKLRESCCDIFFDVAT